MTGLKLRLLMNNWNGKYVATDHADGKGGAICVVASWLVPHILYRGLDFMSRCCWVTVMLSGRVWGFYSVYAPNDLLGRTHLWRWFAQSIPPEWFIGGYLKWLVGW